MSPIRPDSNWGHTKFKGEGGDTALSIFSRERWFKYKVNEYLNQGKAEGK